jgi:hypothetical protein
MVLYTFDYMAGSALPYYYHRFNIFSGSDAKPILVMGQLGKPILHFWDLEQLWKTNENSAVRCNPLDALPPHESLTPELDRGVRRQVGLFRAADWSRDGKWLVAGYDGATLLIWSK